MNLFLETQLDHKLLSDLQPGINNSIFRQIQQRKAELSLTPIADGMSRLASYPPIDLKMGLEVELESCAVKPGVWDIMHPGIFDYTLFPSFFFRVVEDGSLRNMGFEFVSKPGLTGQEILLGLDWLLTSGQIFKKPTNASFRTSIHVHVNVLDYTIRQLKKIIFWYLCLEPLFFSLSGDRSNNIFCVPLAYTNLPIRKLFESKNYNAFLHYLGAFHKYSALNLIPIGDIGTIEFRHHRGTNDYQTIESWMLFIYQFIISAAGDAEQTLQDDAITLFDNLNAQTLDTLMYKKFGFLPADLIDSRKLENHTKNVFSMFINVDALMSEDFDDEESSKKKKSKIKTLEEVFGMDDFAVWVPPPPTPISVNTVYPSGFTIGATPTHQPLSSNTWDITVDFPTNNEE